MTPSIRWTFNRFNGRKHSCPLTFNNSDDCLTSRSDTWPTAMNISIMALIENGTVGHLGTLNGNAVATSAALATLRELGKDGGSVFGKMEKTADMPPDTTGSQSVCWKKAC